MNKYNSLGNLLKISNTLSKHVLYFDVLNIFAAFAVVLLHSNNAVFHYRPGYAWIINLIIEKCFVWAVPIFYMLTGATLLRKNNLNISDYSFKRIKRTVLPFIVWSLVAILYDVKLGYLEIGNFNFFDVILNTKIPNFTIFWFFIPLFAIYLVIPCFICITPQKRVRIFMWIVIYTLISGSILPFFLSFFSIKFNTQLSNPIGGGYIIYPLLGYILSSYDFDKKIRYLIYGSGMLSFFIMFFASYVASVKAHSVRMVYSGGVDFTRVLQAVSVFVFLKQFCQCFSSFLNRYSSQISNCASLTFGVYLIHKFLLTPLLYSTVFNVYAWWWSIVSIPLFCFSLFLVYFIKKLPVLRTFCLGI